MNYLVDSIIKEYVKDFGYKTLCEIGSCQGIVADRMLELAQTEISIIDPCQDGNLLKKYEHNERVKVYKGLSLDILPKILNGFDCILIDGDHNWYTVYNELRIIKERKLLNKGGTIFLHDVGWPYGRRDMYYFPESIPAEFRKPYANRGIVQGQSELSDTGGINVFGNNALFEYGSKNGVLTAIEDHIKEHEGRYEFCNYIDDNGLGVLREKSRLKTSLWIKWRFIIKIHNIMTNVKLNVRKISPTFYSWLKIRLKSMLRENDS